MEDVELTSRQWTWAAVTSGVGVGVLDFVASTGLRDRNGNRLDLPTLNLEHYADNPVVSWLHPRVDDYGQHREPPVGRSTRVWIDDSGAAPRLMASVQFADTAAAMFLFEQYSKGFLRGISTEAKGRGTYVFSRAGGIVGVDWLNADLINLALVPIPADAGALSIVSAGLMVSAGYDGLLLPEDVNGGHEDTGENVEELLDLLRRFQFGDEEA